MQTPPPLRCTQCGALNDPFASQCRACNARGAFGPPAYEEPVSPPPVGRSPRSASNIARWGIAFTGVMVGARFLLIGVLSSSHSHPVQPLVIPTFAPTVSATSLAFAAKLPPARHFAIADDGRAVAFDGDQLQAFTHGGRVTNLAVALGPLAPRAGSSIVVVTDSAYWLAGSDADLVGVVVTSYPPSLIIKHTQAFGELVADDKSIWYTTSDGKSAHKLMRVDVTASKVTPVQVATWSSSRTNEPFIVTDTDVFIVQPADTDAVRVVRVPKKGAAHPSTLITLVAQEEIATLAASTDTLYFTSGPPNETTHDLYRVPLTGGDRTKVFSSVGGVGDVVVADKDVIVADRPNTGWEIDSLPGGDVTQITIVASDVGRQPRLRALPSHIAWSTSTGVTFGDL